jgi:hypothetical protein
VPNFALTEEYAGTVRESIREGGGKDGNNRRKQREPEVKGGERGEASLEEVGPLLE